MHNLTKVIYVAIRYGPQIVEEFSNNPKEEEKFTIGSLFFAIIIFANIIVSIIVPILTSRFDLLFFGIILLPLSMPVSMLLGYIVMTIINGFTNMIYNILNKLNIFSKLTSKPSNHKITPRANKLITK